MSKPSFSRVAVLAVAGLSACAGWFAGRHIAPDSSKLNATAAVLTTNERKIKFYQSPMHPWITSDRPGKCTICGMTLVPVYEGDPGTKTNPSLIILSNTSADVIGVRTTEVKRGPLARSLRVAGVLDDDETLHLMLTARVPGRVEKLHVNQLGAEVAAGQPLATLYSPEILSAQRIYLERLKAGNTISLSELANARERLFSLGFTADDLARLEKSRQPDALLTVHAARTGTVVAREAYEGQYVQPDTTLMEIGDLSHLWFIFDAYEADLPWLHLGQSVEITVPSRPGETITAPIAFIDPNINEATRTARVRVVVPNTDRRLLHRQTANARVLGSTPDALLVPRSAVLFTQREPVVYLDKGGHAYEPRRVKLGRSGDDTYEVLSGLEAGDKVVTQGALLIDGQAQINHATAAAE